jgi:ABC-type transport system substrate-binding protein
MKLYVVALLAASLTLAGCSKGRFSGSTEGKANHVLVATIASNPTKLDPAQVEDGDTIDILNQVFEGLVEYNERNDLVGNLAESWTVSPDGLTYVFKIKQGVKFHSGREMTAEDVKYSWDRAAHPDVLSGTVGTENEAGYMSDIVGFEDVVSGRTTSISGVRVLDPYTLEVRIKSMRAYWPMYLQYPCYFIVDKNSAGLKPMVEVRQMVGTGPFKLDKFIDNQEVHLIRFDDYHKGAPKLQMIKRLVAKDAQNRLQLYQAGRADWVPIERQDKVVVDRDPELKEALVVVDRAAIWYVGFAPKIYAPFQDARVRRAFAMAIDKDRIINQGFLRPFLGTTQTSKGYSSTPARRRSCWRTPATLRVGDCRR